MVTAINNPDAQPRFDLPQVAVKLTTEFGQPMGIVGFQGELLYGC